VRRVETRPPPLPRASPSPRALVTAPQPAKSWPQLRHHLTYLVDRSFEASELRVSDIAGFPPAWSHWSAAALAVLRGQPCTARLHPISPLFRRSLDR
jgi:hypothetical protein